MKPKMKSHPLFPNWFLCEDNEARGAGPTMLSAWRAFSAAKEYAAEKRRVAQ